jgi:hypothetical protein
MELGGWEKDWKEDKENQILFANQDSGMESVTLEMLNNHTFRVGDGNFMGIEYKEGKFDIKDDTILFDTDLIGGKKAVLRNDTSIAVIFLFPVNENRKLNYPNRYRVSINKLNIKIPIFSESELNKAKK